MLCAAQVMAEDGFILLERLQDLQAECRLLFHSVNLASGPLLIVRKAVPAGGWSVESRRRISDACMSVQGGAHGGAWKDKGGGGGAEADWRPRSRPQENCADLRSGNFHQACWCVLNDVRKTAALKAREQRGWPGFNYDTCGVHKGPQHLPGWNGRQDQER